MHYDIKLLGSGGLGATGDDTDPLAVCIGCDERDTCPSCWCENICTYHLLDVGPGMKDECRSFCEPYMQDGYNESMVPCLDHCSKLGPSYLCVTGCMASGGAVQGGASKLGLAAAVGGTALFVVFLLAVAV